MMSKFIVFEGPHGSGKTTQAKLFKNYLDKHCISAIYTKEPYLEDFRKVIDKYSFMDDNLSPYLLLYFHAADRFAHVAYVREKIKRGHVVIADRYLLSGCVYQQIQGVRLELIEQINFSCIKPDITFVLDAPLYERKKRLRKSNRLRNTVFFEEENLKAEEKLYRAIYQRYKTKWKNLFLINGRRDVNEIFKEIIKLWGNI